MAGVFKRQEHYDKANEYYQKSLALRLELLGEKHTDVAKNYNNIGNLYQNIQQYDSAVFYHHKAIKAATLGFESDLIALNPIAAQALEKNALMKYLRVKAEVLTALKREEEALKTYAVAAACASLAMFEAEREQDKLAVAARAHSVHTQAALLHFRCWKTN